MPERVARRAHERVERLANGCWIGTYSKGSHGYAQIGWQVDGKVRMVLAHRAAWVHENGQVPLGMTLDHLCKTRACVNPAHLRLLPNLENARRNNGDDWPMGTCKYGHSNESLRTIRRATKSGGARDGLTCAECHRIRVARSNWRRRHPGEPMPERLRTASERTVA